MCDSEVADKCRGKQDGRKAMGVDGITKDEYNVSLEENLTNLVERMKKSPRIRLLIREFVFYN